MASTWTGGVESVCFALSEPAHVELAIFSVTGAKVTTLLAEWRPAGEHVARFDAAGLPTGVYFCRLRAGDRCDARKVMLLH